MAFSELGSVFAKALGGLGDAAEAVVKPAIPELAQRGTAEAPTVLQKALQAPKTIVSRTPEVPFTGVPELEQATRATQAEYTPSLADRIQKAKTTMGSFFRSDPNLPKDMQATMLRGRQRMAVSDITSDLDFQHVYEPLTTDPVAQASLMHNYLITADEVSQALRNGKDTIHDMPVEKWTEQLNQLQPQVEADPQIQEALTRRGKLWDDVFDDMVNRGWTVPEHYLEDYTPIRKLHGVAQGLAANGGEDLRSALLASMQHRTGAPGLRETNLIALEKSVLSNYYHKVSGHEMFLDFLNDPTVNMTDKFTNGDIVPRGLSVYRPGPGMVGYTRKSDDGFLLDGMIHGVGVPDEHVTPNGYVFPKPLVDALNSFHPPKQGEISNAFYNTGRKLARWLTVYNPANTRLNMVSDLAMAMFGGIPGEKAQPLGIFKWYNKVGLPAGYKGAFGKGGTHVTLNGQTVDVWDLAQREGLTEGTIHHEVMGQRLSDELARLIPPEQRHNANPVLDALSRDRLATEAAPRIAAGLEAAERTGDWKQFGRVGRTITLDYGAGAPAAAKLPVVKLISPFLQFIGLASGRVFDLLNAPESRNRAMVGVLAVPMVTHMWNSQNDEYKKVEDSLSDWERSQAHVIVPDPTDPTKVRRDITGKPVVLRFRYWVPEDVMRTAGLGNLTSRVMRVVKGRDTPLQFAQSIPTDAASNISDLMTMPGLIKQVATGKTDQGRDMTLPERATRLFPIAHPVTEALASSDYGPGEMAKRFAEETGGVRFASVSRRGTALRDTDLLQARQKMQQARAAWRTALLNGPPSKQRQAKQDFYNSRDEFKRLVDVIKKEKSDGSNQK